MPVATLVDDFIQARHQRDRRGWDIGLLVLHTANSGSLKAPGASGSATARNVATYFSHTSVKASSHTVTDPWETIGCVNQAMGAYGASTKAINRGLHYEMTAYAEWDSSQWNHLDYSVPMLDRLARLVAEDVITHGIPIRRLSVQEIQRGNRGIVDHYDTNKAWRNGRGHTDIGPHFPWSWFLGEVQAYVKWPNRLPVLTIGDRAGKASLGPTSGNVGAYDGVVYRLQKKLLSLGFNLGTSGPQGDGADDHYGTLTGEAVRAYREKRKLRPGITVDREAWALLQGEQDDPQEESPTGDERLDAIKRHAKAIWLLADESG